MSPDPPYGRTIAKIVMTVTALSRASRGPTASTPGPAAPSDPRGGAMRLADLMPRQWDRPRRFEREVDPMACCPLWGRVTAALHQPTVAKNRAGTPSAPTNFTKAA